MGTAPDRVAVGRYQPTAPTDPYVRALTHTVPRIRDSLRFPENRADGTYRGQRIAAKDGTEFRPDHRADSVAAVKPMPPNDEPDQTRRNRHNLKHSPLHVFLHLAPLFPAARRRTIQLPSTSETGIKKLCPTKSDLAPSRNGS